MYFLLNMEIFYCYVSYTHRVSSIINRNHVMWRQPFVLLGSTSLILRQTLVLAVTFGMARLAQQPATIEWSVSMGCHLSIFQHFLRLLLATQDHYWKKIHANFVKPIFFLTKASFLYISFIYILQTWQLSNWTQVWTEIPRNATFIESPSMWCGDTSIRFDVRWEARFRFHHHNRSEWTKLHHRQFTEQKHVA